MTFSLSTLYAHSTSLRLRWALLDTRNQCQVCFVMMNTVTIGTGARQAIIGGAAPALIMGPCVIESREHCLFMAEQVAAAAEDIGFPTIFKASFDKANRTSHTSFRGPGFKQGLDILAEVKERTGLPVTSDIHGPEQCAPAAEVLNLLQVPAFLCRQTDLIVAVAETGTPTSIKKGQFLAPWDMQQVVDKFHTAGGTDLVLMERGSSFGYNNLVSDMRSLPIMRSMGVPVIYDGTHSVQMPGGNGTTSGGAGHLAPALMRAAMAVGVEGLFLEVHDNPAQAASDGPNMVPLHELPALLAQIKAIHDAIGRPQPAQPANQPSRAA